MKLTIKQVSNGFIITYQENMVEKEAVATDLEWALTFMARHFEGVDVCITVSDNKTVEA